MFRSVMVIAALTVGALPAFAAEKSDPRCELYGEGFIYSKDTGICIKISGEIRADYTFGKDTKGFGTQTRVKLDARKDTEFGPFRMVVEPKISN